MFPRFLKLLMVLFTMLFSYFYVRHLVELSFKELF